MYPLVSIIIPIYNADAYLDETLNSVLKQSYSNYEVLMIDDGSTDLSVEIMKKYTKIDERFKSFSIKNSGGPAKPRNLGLKYSNGTMIAFLDSDDIWYKHKLFIQTEYMIKTNSAMSHMYYRSFSDENNHRIYYKLYPKDENFFQGIIFNNLIIKSEIGTSTVMIKKSCTDDIGLFDENNELVAVEDYDYWLRVAKKYNISFINCNYNVLYRKTQNNISNNRLLQLDKRLKVLKKHKNEIAILLYFRSHINIIIHKVLIIIGIK